MITDRTSTEDLKEKLTQQEINRIAIENKKKKGTPKLDTAIKVIKTGKKMLERM